jgi:hypothetical protein
VIAEANNEFLQVLTENQKRDLLNIIEKLRHEAQRS